MYLVLRLHAAEALYILRLMLPKVELGHGPRIIPVPVVNFVKRELARRVKQVGMTDVFQLARLVRSYRRLFAAERLHLIRQDGQEPIAQDPGVAYCRVFQNLYLYLQDALQAREVMGEKIGEPLDGQVKSFAKGYCDSARTMAKWIGKRGQS
jgi:hypothetical protein